jgi:hypothetical protein
VPDPPLAGGDEMPVGPNAAATTGVPRLFGSIRNSSGAVITVGLQTTPQNWASSAWVKTPIGLFQSPLTLIASIIRPSRVPYV